MSNGIYDYVDDVKKRLAEKDKRIAELEEFYKQYSARISNLYDTPLFATGTFGTFKILSVEEYDDMKDKISNLEKQLAEKTLTIEQINKAFIENRSLWKGKYEQSNQDKISFAVKQLEKVKELLNTDFESIISWIDPYEYGECLNSMTYNHKNTIEIIDNQINELKRFLEI